MLFDRCLATQAAVKVKEEAPKQQNAVKESQSFTMNLFRGQLQLSQVCPFPEPLNQEQTETIRLLVDPVEKFYEVNAIYGCNDQSARVPITFLLSSFRR